MINIAEYEVNVKSEWDEFVKKSPVGNFLHTREFLSYHGDKFNDKSLYIKDNKGKLIAVFNAAEALDDSSCIVSHPGSTYGGLVASANCKGSTCIKSIEAIAEYYLNAGYKKLIYKAVPYIYHCSPSQDDLYALFRLNAKRVQSDLSACVDLNSRGKISGRRKRALKKAFAASVEVKQGRKFIEPLWEILLDNLQRKHDASPVHALDEIKKLYEMFSDDIEFVVATLNEEVISGVVLFNSKNVAHAQYIASSETGYQSSGLDVVFDFCIKKSMANGKRYFDFGTSNEKSGLFLNDGLYQFKSEFGAGGVVHDRFELQLRK